MADIGTCVITPDQPTPDCPCEVTPLACAHDPSIEGDFIVLVENYLPTSFTIVSLTAGHIY
jgi:hypothetical protein